MNQPLKIYPHLLRPALLIGGLLLYVLFTRELLLDGHIQITHSSYFTFMLIWGLGFVALLSGAGRGQGPSESMAFLRALWCNLGVVVLAALVMQPVLRMLLLVVPLFGVLYASLHMTRLRVVLLAMVTWFVFIVGRFALVDGVGASAEHDYAEALGGLGFACLLSGGLLMAWEVLLIRDRLHERNESLRGMMVQLQDLASRDELTGVYNRRYLLEVLERQKALVDRGQQAFTVCYCDLDHFKAINDQFGHEIGDKALKAFAQLAQSVVRNVDYVARFGGEEFLLVLVDADPNAAAAVAQRMVDLTSSIKVEGAPPEFALSTSVGVARYDASESIEAVLRRADSALYAAKGAGRDRVVLA